MRSVVKWALLGLVIQRPSYGYELVQRFERTYGDSLELSSPSQVYVALDTLEGREMVHRVLPEDTPLTRQPKLHYRATDHGLESFQDWLVEHVHHDRSRAHLFACQLAMLPRERALAVLDRYERLCLQQASKASPGRRAGAADEREHTIALSQRLAVEDERLTLEARLEWVQYARLQFTAAPAPRPKTR